MSPEALGLVRENMASMEVRLRKDPWQSWGAFPIALMERFGVPESVPLEPIVAWANGQSERRSGHPIPGPPHPYDGYLFVLRVQRLLERHRPK